MPRRRVSVLPLAFVLAAIGMQSWGVSADAAEIPRPAPSVYERSADPTALYHQGQAAGRSGVTGAVILDFGRPAYQAPDYGTMDYAGHFVPLAAILSAAESYVAAYYTYGPRHAALEVVVGTNNSCGAGQPCGRTPACGCRFEPASFREWGRHLALAVEQAAAFSSALGSRPGYTDVVRVAAGDDAEPGFDPGYRNTYELLAGYAAAASGAWPPMVDFGDAAPHPWSLEQLYQVAYGFAPDVPFPEIYYPAQARWWATLARYARARHGVALKVLGVLSQDPVGNTPEAAYTQLLEALGPVTGQTRVPWLSEIGPDRRGGPR